MGKETADTAAKEVAALLSVEEILVSVRLKRTEAVSSLE